MKIPFKSFLYFLVIVMAVLAVYHPVITIDYIFHDDISFLEGEPGQLTKYGLFDMVVGAGRPLAALLFSLYDWSVDRIEDLKMVRLIVLLQVSFAGWLLLMWLKHYLFTGLQSLLITLMIITLPAFQVFASYGGIAPHFTPVWLSFIAALCVQRSQYAPSLLKWITQKYTLTAILLLFVALLIYPSTAMFYWTPFAFLLLAPQTDKINKRGQTIIYGLSVGFIALGLYALYLKLSKPFFMTKSLGMYNPYESSINIIEKLKWFLSEPLVNALNLWNVYPDPTFTRLFLSLLTLTIVSIFCRTLAYRHGHTILRLLEKALTFVLVFGFMLLSYLPNLMAPNNAPWYRCSAGLTAIILMIGLVALRHLFNWLKSSVRWILFTLLLTIGCLFGMYQAHGNILTYRVMPSHIETTHIKTTLKCAGIHQYDIVHFIRPQCFSPRVRYDEFGVLSTYYPANHEAFLIAVYRDLGLKDAAVKKRIGISTSLPGENKHFSTPALIIDTNQIAQDLFK